MGGGNSLIINELIAEDAAQASFSFKNSNNYRFDFQTIQDIETFAERVRALASDSSCDFEKIIVFGSASPEGEISNNANLALRRAQALSTQLEALLPGIPIDIKNRVIDYDSLTSLVIEDANVPSRDRVLEILKDKTLWQINGSNIIDLRRPALMALDNMVPWNYLMREHFPKLRYAAAKIKFFHSEIPEDAFQVPDTVFVNHIKYVERIDTIFTIIKETERLTDTIYIPNPNSIYERINKADRSILNFRLRTNLAYDAMMVPNIGLEIGLGSNYSLGANWAYAWWKTFNKETHRYRRVYGGELCFRKYFGSKDKSLPVIGHHVGIYSQILTYDIEFNNQNGYLSKLSYGMGAEYGYQIPINKHFNIDFTIGLGYFGGEYKKWIPAEGCRLYQKTDRLNWFGPTKLEVSLVWIFGNRNNNRQNKYAEKGEMQ